MATLKSRLAALELSAKEGQAPAYLIAILQAHKEKMGDDSPTPESITLSEALRQLIEIFPD